MVRQSVPLAMACASLLGCDAALEALGWISPPQLGTSPLVGADAEQIYTIVHFSESFNEDCRDYFAAPLDPRNVKYTGICEAKELEMADWLRANGFSTLEPGHLRLESFWTGILDVSRSIERCNREVQERTKTWSEEQVKALNECSPVTRGPKTPWGFPDAELAGIRRPTRSEGGER
jgi:hypothetical protein